MGRKIVTVPKDKATQEALDFDTADPRDLLEFDLTPDEFRILWESGVFAAINAKLGTMIDDFEDERIIGTKALTKANLVLTEIEEWSTGSVLDALSILKLAFREALARDTEVHFYF